MLQYIIKIFQSKVLVCLYLNLLIFLLRINAPIIPNIETVIPVFHFISFCLTFIIIATIEVGTKNTRFAPCAMCWSFPKNNERHNISIVPPPMPIPLTIPDIIPINIFSIYSPFRLAF